MFERMKQKAIKDFIFSLLASATGNKNFSDKDFLASVQSHEQHLFTQGFNAAREQDVEYGRQFGNKYPNPSDAWNDFAKQAKP